jgi:hypothetical protein
MPADTAASDQRDLLQSIDNALDTALQLLMMATTKSPGSSATDSAMMFGTLKKHAKTFAGALSNVLAQLPLVRAVERALAAIDHQVNLGFFFLLLNFVLFQISSATFCSDEQAAVPLIAAQVCFDKIDFAFHSLSFI